SRIKGVVHLIQSQKNLEQRMVRVDHSEMTSDTYEIPAGWNVQVKDEGEVSIGDVLAQLEDATIAAQHAGRVRIEDNNVIVSYENRETEEYDIPPTARLMVKEGQIVEGGEPLTEGSLNPHTILYIKGREATELYLMTEIQK